MTSDVSSATATEYSSPYAFVLTLDRVVEVIRNAGMTVFAHIDHAAGAREVGMTMPPTVVLLYGNPKGGTPIMLAEPRAALELPLRVLLRQDADGRTKVSFHPIGLTLMAVGVPADLAGRLEPAQKVLLEALQA